MSPKPRTILGLMTFGPDPSAGARVTDPAELTRALDLLHTRGYQPVEVDTARVYVGGKQEGFTGGILKDVKGEVKVATKVVYPKNPGMNGYEEVIKSVETSLGELGVERVEVLYLHAADRSTPFTTTLRAINTLHTAGKFTHFGLSNFTAFEVAEIALTCAHNNWVRPTLYQAMYNAITRSIEGELVPACRRYGLDIVVYNPLAGGLFSGKIKSGEMVPAEGRYSDTSEATGRLYRGRYFRESTFKALQVVERAVEAAGGGLTMIETGLRWAVYHSALRVGGVDGKEGNDGVILGVSSVEQLDANLTALEKGPLPEGVVKALDEAWAVSKADTAPYWHLDVKYGYDTQEVLFGKAKV